MAVRNSSLIPPRHYANHPTMQEEQPSTAAIPRQQSEFLVETPTSQSKQPQFLKSIDDLAAFSTAVDAFKRQFDDLQKHIESIENAIDSNLKSNGVDLTASSSSFHKPSPLTIETTAPEEPTETVPEISNKPEGKQFCELMCSKGLRRYIYANISDRANLMEEIPKALKVAKEPAKFVLESIGKFYVQGRKAFTKDSPTTTARLVSLLILESFLLMLDSGGEGKVKIEIESCVKDEAEIAAVAWRKRLMSEGGLASAEQMDARGLLLLIACFGVPSCFRRLDLLDLLKQCGLNEIVGALRRSPFLVPMISGIVFCLYSVEF